MIKSTPARIVLEFKWLFVTFVLAFAICLGKFDVPLNPKAPPPGPPAASSTQPAIFVRLFDTRSEAEHACGKSNVTSVEEISSTESKDDAGYICSDWDDRGPLQ
jgi:hypothetical protein